MHFELAPLEGVTTWIYRSACHRHFVPAHRYFTPFIAPNMNKGINTRERNDVLPEHNQGLSLVPQILTNRADYFLTTCRDLAELGYEEVNLNLGCPSGTVVALSLIHISSMSSWSSSNATGKRCWRAFCPEC